MDERTETTDLAIPRTAIEERALAIEASRCIDDLAIEAPTLMPRQRPAIPRPSSFPSTLQNLALRERQATMSDGR